MRFPSRCFGLLLALLSTGTGAQSLWVEAKVLTPLRVELPKHMAPGRTYPLVLLLHGRGGSGEAMLSLRGRLGGESFILAAPQGPYAQGEGFRWFLSTQDPKLWAHTDAQAVELIQRTLQALKQRHPVSHVYLLGHSEGAALAYLAAVKLRAEVDGLLAFGAGKPSALLEEADLAVLKGLPHFLAHGQNDRTSPYGELPARVTFWQSAGVPTTFVGYPGGHGLNDAPVEAAAAWILKQEQAQAPAAP
jgi:predicted esterase